jgi:hypothetical protein
MQAGVQVDNGIWLRPDTIIRVAESAVSFAHTDIEYWHGEKPQLLHSSWRLNEVLAKIGWT